MKTQSYGSQFLAGFLAGVAVLFVLGLVTGRDISHIGKQQAATTSEQTSDKSPMGAVPEDTNAALAVHDQKAGMTVKVDHAELSSSGWVVVHEVADGHVLNALGAARFDAGAHDNITVDLLRGTELGSTYAIILYSDNDDKKFELKQDLPVIDGNGNPVMQTFRTFGGAAGQ